MRHFKVIEFHNWEPFCVGYFKGKNHKEVASQMKQPNKRIYNERYNEIEKTGDYYVIDDLNKNEFPFIYEIIK